MSDSIEAVRRCGTRIRPPGGCVGESPGWQMGLACGAREHGQDSMGGQAGCS